jgi:hypothetical protein
VKPKEIRACPKTKDARDNDFHVVGYRCGAARHPRPEARYGEPCTLADYEDCEYREV